MENAALISVRARKLGVMLRGIRNARGKNPAECAAALGISQENYEAFERGEQSPAMPQLELLAFYYKIPLEAFWSNELPQSDEAALDLAAVNARLNLRNRVIGALIRKRRLERELSQADLAAKAGISEEQLRNYESGRLPVPVPVLEVLSEAMVWTVSAFQDDRGVVGTFFVQERSMRDFKELSPELQKFVVQPVNRPYLELAKRLSEMDVAKLRNVAEGLLEITL